MTELLELITQYQDGQTIFELSPVDSAEEKAAFARLNELRAKLERWSARTYDRTTARACIELADEEKAVICESLLEDRMRHVASVFYPQ